MRRSFGGGSSMGGGSGGGGGMLRSVHRAVRAGIGGAPPEPFSPSAGSGSGSGSVSTSSSRKTKKSRIKQPSSPNKNLTLSNSSNNNNNGSSAFSSLINLPISAASGAAAPAWRACPSPTCDDLEWEVVEGSGGDERAARAFYDDFVFGTIPSRDEVQHAVSALQQVAGIRYPSEELADGSGTNFPNENGSPMGIIKSISSEELESDWIEPSPYLCDSKMLQPRGSQVYDAFHLLQTDPSVQRMVISLSSDKAVWDAVLNNDVVRELRGSITQVDNEVRESAEAASDDGSNPLKDIMDWVFVNAGAKIMELINKITEIVHDVFHPSDEGKKDDTTDSFEEKLRTSLLLSVVVLLIVVISRLQSALS